VVSFFCHEKAPYRIRNWSEYNASLKQRGRGAIWVSSEATPNWTTDELTGEHGAKAAIPQRKGAKIWRHANSKAERHVRDVLVVLVLSLADERGQPQDGFLLAHEVWPGPVQSIRVLVVQLMNVRDYHL